MIGRKGAAHCYVWAESTATETRLRKLDDGVVDATLLALAGLKRKVVELESQIGELSAAHEKAQRQAREGSVRYDNLSADHRQLKRKLESAELLQSELQESAESRDATLALLWPSASIRMRSDRSLASFSGSST